MFKIVVVLVAIFSCSSAINPGPVVQATKGEVWPKPQQQEKSQDFFVIRPHTFSFKAPDNIGCPNFLNDALTRYWTIIATATLKKSWTKQSLLDLDSSLGNLDSLTIELTGECASEEILPAFGDDENYSLTVSAEESLLSAATIWGVLRGLETFSQLIYSEQDVLVINATSITDFPTHPYRGLLLDTSRHFEPVSIIFKTLDAMAYNKLNVFHWHLTDDHSFPYKSRAFPELSDEGAYHPVATVYEQSDVKRVIEYARLRGIRVVPEFDTPGHTRSWGVSHPELLTSCYTGDEANGQLGPMDPSKNTTYEFISQLFAEVTDVFPDSYFHIGGDEVDFECWKSNPDLTAFMAANDLASYEKLENYFIQHVVDILDGLGSNYLVWEEVFVNGVDLPESTVVHVWKFNGGPATLNQVTKAGKYALYSSCWYLSNLHSGGDWNLFYDCYPLEYVDTDEQRQLILGGEVCMWGEYVNEHSVMQRVWPRASAAAERLWSAANVKDMTDAQRRIEEHACRMNRRGIEAQPPNGPGVCL